MSTITDDWYVVSDKAGLQYGLDLVTDQEITPGGARRAALRLAAELNANPPNDPRESEYTPPFRVMYCRRTVSFERTEISDDPT